MKQPAIMKGWKSTLTLLFHGLPVNTLRKGQDVCTVLRNRYHGGFLKLCAKASNGDVTTLGSTSTHNCTNTHNNANTNPNEKVSIAVVGTGAIGSYYGGRLWERKDLYNVKFHMRSTQNLDACRKKGLQIQSIAGDIFIPPSEIQIYSNTEDMGKTSFDWVILALKSTAMPHIPTLLKPLLHNQTRVLAIMNGLIDYDLVESLRSISTSKDLPCAAIYGGMAFIGCNRLSPGLVDHTDQGALSAGLAASAASNKPYQGVVHDMEALADLWRPTKVKFMEETYLIRGRWIKNCWNLPFNSISCAMGGILTIDTIVKDPSLRKLADDIMDETIAIANADLASRGIDPSLYLDDTVKKRMWDITDAMGPYKTSTMLDLINRRPMEVKYLFRKPLEIAESLQIKAPKLEALTAQIESLQRHYNLF